MERSRRASRWQLFRLLGEPARLRVLASAEHAELSLGELAEAIGESLPNTSRHASQLRQAGLLSERRIGTRTFVTLASRAEEDSVLQEAISIGRALCEETGVFGRIAELIRRRDARTRELLTATTAAAAPDTEFQLYLTALRESVPARELAVCAGSADGACLDVLVPIFRRVLMLLPSAIARPSESERRAEMRGYSNVMFLRADADELLRPLIGAGADFALLVLGEQREQVGVRRVLSLLRPGARLSILDRSSETESLESRGALSGLEQVRVQRGLEVAGRTDFTDVRVLSAVRSG
ncbi:MAG: ArsR/SmtB family transcription factor [Myxococcota bacterium]